MSKGKKVLFAVVVIVCIGMIGSAFEKNSTDFSDSSSANTKKIIQTEPGILPDAEPETEESASVTVTAGSEKTSVQNGAVAGRKDQSGDFQMTMLDVGQGLSILIESDGEYMLYDGGGRSRSSYVVAYLKSHGITELEYIVASHYDEDHIAGLIGVMNTTTVKTVLDGDYTTDTKIYHSYKIKLAACGAEEIHPVTGNTYTLGSAEFKVISPKNYSYSSDNSRSIAIRVTCGSFSALLTGDAESDAENDIISSGQNISSDVYVVGHHGSSAASSPSFIDRVSPSYVFVSCGKNNAYGHPAQKTMNTFRSRNISVFRSDMQGEVTCSTDGTEYWFSTEPCNNYTSGTIPSETTKQTTAASGTTASGSKEYTYVLNTNTHKFHYTYCNSVTQMADHNRKYSCETREEIIANGYSPCGNCKP